MCYSIKENKIEFSFVVGQNKLVVSFYVIVILMGREEVSLSDQVSTLFSSLWSITINDRFNRSKWENGKWKSIRRNDIYSKICIEERRTRPMITAMNFSIITSA